MFERQHLIPRSYPAPGSMIEGYVYDGPITFNEYGWIASGSLPCDCVESCSASGPVDDAVEFWVRKLPFQVPRDLAVSYLREYGAWDDLETAEDETLAQRVLWTACCDIRESGEWLGLVR